jgi:hypothetical protein
MAVIAVTRPAPGVLDGCGVGLQAGHERIIVLAGHYGRWEMKMTIKPILPVRDHIQFWINDKPVMTYDDPEYKTGHFAIQGHNPGMKVEAKELYYLDLGK